jgi:hypothetical protein
MAIASLRALAGKIPAGEHFARFYRRLVERVDLQQMTRENRFQHEVHHQSTQRPLVKPAEIESAHRPAGRN